MRTRHLLTAFIVAIGIASATPNLWAQETNERPGTGAAQQEGARRGPGRRRQQDGVQQQDRQADGARRFAILLQLFDTDRSGDLSTTEIEAMATTVKAMDRDDDGKVTPAEIMQAVGQRRPTDRRRPGADPNAEPGNNQNSIVDPQQMIERLISRADKDGDQLISKDEAPARLQENFDRLDANGDGKLSADEMKSMIDRMRGRGAQRNGGDALQGVEPKRPGKGGGGDSR